MASSIIARENLFLAYVCSLYPLFVYSISSSSEKEKLKGRTFTRSWLVPEIGRLDLGKAKVSCRPKVSIHTQRARTGPLISGTGKKTATFLELLKETAMRAGEAKRLLWTDVDMEKLS
jgi:hypothetical protein